MKWWIPIALLLTGCGLTRVPPDEEWLAVSNLRAQVERIRTEHPISGDTRIELIESHLSLQRVLGETHARYIAQLERLHASRGDQRAAGLLARENMLLGDTYADVLGRHDRAMEYYLAGLEVSPGDLALLERLDRSRERIFISQSEFARVRTGMRESDVESILGYPRVNWVRQTVRRGRVYSAWIYPKKGGGAAAVYLDDGIVYHKNWTASE